MRGANLFRKALGLIGLGLGLSSAQQDTLNCTKISTLLCNMLRSAQSDTTKFAVDIILHPPEQDPACKSVDPKTDTSGKCPSRDWASPEYKAKILAEANTLFTTYELWSFKNPSERLQPPTEPQSGFTGILATKKTLIDISREGYINFLERYIVDCTKMGVPLCSMMKNAQSDTVMLAVSISLYPPEQDPACKSVDPKTDTSGKCANRGWWSPEYKAKILSEANTLFTTYELWSFRNPTERLQPPTEPMEGFLGVLATKKTLVDISRESYINNLDRYIEQFPIGTRLGKETSKKTGYHAGKKGASFQVDGRKLNGNPVPTPAMIRPIP